MLVITITRAIQSLQRRALTDHQIHYKADDPGFPLIQRLRSREGYVK